MQSFRTGPSPSLYVTFRDRPGATLVDAFARVGAQPDKRTGLSHRGLIVTAPLDDLFLGIAKAEGYEEILACVLAAEWMYLTWCSMAEDVGPVLFFIDLSLEIDGPSSRLGQLEATRDPLSRFSFDDVTPPARAIMEKSCTRTESSKQCLSCSRRGPG